MPSTLYNTLAADGGKRVQWLVEIDLFRCGNVYTQSPCTAADAGDGLRCWHTFPTCQDPDNYGPPPGGPGVRTLRFCLSDVPWSDRDVQVIPALRKLVAIPQRIDCGCLATFPAQVTFSMGKIYNPPPPDHDKGDGFHNTTRLGEFWGNLFARNRNWSGRPVRFYRGFSTSPDEFPLADFEQVGPVYSLKSIKWGNDVVTLAAESPLAQLNKVSIPCPLSDDNQVEEDGGATAGQTTIEITNASELPDPANYTRNRIYVEIESEILEVSSVNTSTNELTVVRGQFGTPKSSHAEGAQVRHVACFGTVGGTPVNAIDVLQDLIEWASVAAGAASAGVATAAFDSVRDVVWPELNVVRIIRKAKKVAKLVQQIRDPRSVVVFINADGDFSCRTALPDTDGALLDSDQLVENSVTISEDDEDRITRALFFYDPAEDGAFDAEDFARAVIVVDAQLESDNFFDGFRDRVILDLWLAPASTVASVQNIARRLINRFKFGVRTFNFQLETRDATGLSVGDLRTFESDKLIGLDGLPERRPMIVTANRERERGMSEFEGLDVQFGGRFFRMGPTTMAELYDNATAADQLYGYWGDPTTNRVGTQNVAGYVLY